MHETEMGTAIVTCADHRHRVGETLMKDGHAGIVRGGL